MRLLLFLCDGYVMLARLAGLARLLGIRILGLVA